MSDASADSGVSPGAQPDAEPAAGTTPTPPDNDPTAISGVDPMVTPVAARPTASFFDAVGGEETFTRLVARFYEGVRDDMVLRPLYPEEDLGPAEERLRLFLMQYWGGPDTYHQTRGHPRLRLRHAPFAIGVPERDAWLRHMADAVVSLDLPDEQEGPLWDYLVNAAAAMQNR